MSLFVVNRYQGTEDAVPDTTNSSNHLTDLFKKIELRKKRRSTTGVENEVGANEENEILKASVPKKKRKKQKGNESKETSQSEQGKTAKDVLVTQNGDPASPTEQESSEKTVEPTKKAALQKQDFLILGSDSRKKKPIVKRVLPDWLSKPELISADVNSGPPLSNFKSILDPKLLDILEKSGANKLFPVQASTIPWILECDKHRKAGWWPQDVCISAPTGSGKTLAYVLPVIQQLQHRLVRKVRCLVILPVQELAAQVYKVMKTYSAHTKLRVTLLSGGASFHQEQTNLIKQTECGKHVSKVDIIVTTPGRLIDHIEKTPGFSLESLRFLIIDEADRDTDWLQYLPAHHYGTTALNILNMKSSVNRPAQKLLFSATLSQDPEKLSRLGLFQPKLFTSVLPEDKDHDLNLDKDSGDFVGRYTSPDELVEKAMECELFYKPLALYKLLSENEGPQRTLVFTNSGNMTHRLALLMGVLGKDKGLTVAEISGQLSHKEREIVLSKFSRGDIQVLISSDALARGMDIPGVKLVVSYDCPKHIKGYIHRSGRTGRAGTPGTAVSLLSPTQVGAFTQMLNSARKKVPDIDKLNLESFADLVDYEKYIDDLGEILKKEEAEALTSLKSVKRKHHK